MTKKAQVTGFVPMDHFEFQSIDHSEATLLNAYLKDPELLESLIIAFDPEQTDHFNFISPDNNELDIQIANDRFIDYLKHRIHFNI